MPPPLMAVVCIIGIVGLFVLGREKGPQPSKALWIPLAWLFINCSRPLSQWLAAFGLGGSSSAGMGQIYMEGSPLDGAFFSVLLLAGLIVLAHRSVRVFPYFGRMLPILTFFLYCGISILWSDYPFVAFKHWNKGIGDLVMVLVILTDPEPYAAFKRVLTRLATVLLPLSLLFSKYYPSIGRSFSIGGVPLYNGVTAQKNTLGVICLIFGLGSLWRLLTLYRDGQAARRTQQLIAQGTILTMAVWLLWLCNSMTSIMCLVMGVGLLVLANRPMAVRWPAVVHLLVAAILGLSLFAVFFDSSGGLVQDLGRNSTLTGRTDIWDAVLPFAGNPLIGTGYESFWLGTRLQKFWSVQDGAFYGIQEAHNGYLELYLNLGWIGIALLATLIVVSYPRVIATYRNEPSAGSLGLAFFVGEVVYNYTEAGFRMMFPLWIFFLLAVLGVPKAPDPQSLSTFDADLADDFVSGEAHVDHIAVGLR
jgi:exopolysaccharide production protein ExoQ